jgi:hypothetical protein
MIVYGRELQVISSARTIYLHVPFKGGKVPLGESERTMLKQLGDRAMATRDTLVPLPGTDEDRRLMLRSTAAFDLAEAVRTILLDTLTRILVQHESAPSMQPYLPPIITRADFVPFRARLATLPA